MMTFFMLIMIIETISTDMTRPVRLAYAPPATQSRLLQHINTPSSPEHRILSGEKFTVLMKTIPRSVYFDYQERMQSAKNDHMIVLSESGIGAPEPNTPSRVIHAVEDYNYFKYDNTSLWSPGIRWVPDYRAGAEGLSDNRNSGRVYLRAAAFCQGFGTSLLDELKGALFKVMDLVGRASPALAPYLAPTAGVVKGIFLIINKLESQGMGNEIMRTSELSLWPIGTGDQAGYPALRRGSYVLFFEDVYLENLELNLDNIVVGTSARVERIPPYLVIDILGGLLALPSAPSENQLSASQGLDILEKYDSKFRIPAKDEPSETGKLIEGLIKIGESSYQVSLITRFLYLKTLANPLPTQVARLEELREMLQSDFSGINWNL